MSRPFINTLNKFIPKHLTSLSRFYSTPTTTAQLTHASPKMAPRNASEVAMTQETDIPLKISEELCSAKTYIVTGANVGLGLEAARHLVGVGASKVILAVRNLEAGETARADIESTTGIKNVAEVWPLDLASYESVKSFAAKANELERLDAVIENAAIAGMGDKFAEGHRIPITVNVVSTFYLAALLLPKLRADAAKFGYIPRLSIVTSGTGLDLDDYWKSIADDPINKIDSSDELAGKIYPATKLLEILAVKHLANVLPLDQNKVIINSINPGLCVTTLSRYAPQAFKDHLRGMWEQCGRTAEEGSRTLLAGAVGEEDSHGAYMDACVAAQEKVPVWLDDTAGKQAWDAIAQELEKIEQGIVQKALN